MLLEEQLQNAAKDQAGPACRGAATFFPRGVFGGFLLGAVCLALGRGSSSVGESSRGRATGEGEEEEDSSGEKDPLMRASLLTPSHPISSSSSSSTFPSPVRCRNLGVQV